ncbi:response regulator [Myxococcota bacterium]|nr:response regulator [Myxococcota bacterium]
MIPTLLLVDSESAFRQRLTESLQAKGYRVLVTNKPSEALHLLLKEPIAFLLVEGLLPEMNGHKLIQRLREQGHSCAIIFVSALSVFVRDIKIFRELTRDLGVYKVLSKPLNLDELLLYIEHLVPPPSPQAIAETTAEISPDQIPHPTDLPDAHPTDLPASPSSEDVIFIDAEDDTGTSHHEPSEEDAVIDLGEADEISEIEEIDELFPEVGPPLFHIDVPRSERSGADLDRISAPPPTPARAKTTLAYDDDEGPAYTEDIASDIFSEQTMFAMPSIPALLGEIEEQQQEVQRQLARKSALTNPLLPDPSPEKNPLPRYDAQDAVTSGDLGSFRPSLNPKEPTLPRITKSTPSPSLTASATLAPKASNLTRRTKTPTADALQSVPPTANTPPANPPPHSSPTTAHTAKPSLHTPAPSAHNALSTTSNAPTQPELLDDLESQLYELLQHISSARQSYFPQEPLQFSYHLVQQVYGIAAALEHHQLNEVIAEIEQAIWILLYQNPDNTTPFWQGLLERVEWCLLTIEYLQHASPAQTSASEFAQMPPETTMLVVGQKPETIPALLAWGQEHRVRVLASDDWEALQQILESNQIDVLFLDVSLSRDGMAAASGQTVRQETSLINSGILWIEWIRSRPNMEQVPVLFLTDQAELHHRILASYITPSQLLNQPLRKQAWLDALHRLTGHQTIRRSHILLAPDESGFAQDVGDALTRAGFAVHTLSSPLLLLDTLEEINPDLLLLSLSVPGFSGMDLCRVIRSTPRWSDLTTLLLSPALEGKLRTTALQIGFHDIVTQNMHREEITALVQLRLQRTQTTQQQRYRDNNTGLLTRHVFLERASALLAEAKAFQRPFVLALLQIHAWDALAQQHGPEARQITLIQLAQHIQNHTRPFDLLGRLDDSCLAIAFPSTDGLFAQQTLQCIFEHFYQNPIPSKHYAPFSPLLHSALSEYNDPSHTLDALLDRAHLQLQSQLG